ncbi:type III secretion system protein [Candidatus Symbiopectobacterium sp. NZEC151]|uniref:type III secretion system protein n=1 Tax=Candidatus Symbiopectobacterium sp. NZEC151 TaxID=2820470 RepID=UPI0022265C5D|nr:type III secretion system protein [Candidatus Symbiopectobacterium sp. NZEC151]MCW2474872.1 type III secretion system protein [Candidatus Symbiopectobacterium sp. NZEC151]
MNICHEQLFRILYHPVAYAHPSHLPDTWRAKERASEPLLNYWLYRRYQLASPPKNWDASCTLAAVMIKQWHNMPDIAHLLGGYLLKSSMSDLNLALFSDPQLLNFIALPLMHHVDPGPLKQGRYTMLACGARFILNQCHPIPQALQQRFMLLFPTGIELPKIDAPPTPDHLNLFNMATHYANNFPGRTA